MKTKNLKTIKDVEKFFYHLLNDLKINFHIDIPFEDYIITKSGKQLFTQKQVKKYNNLMYQAEMICDKNNVCVYDLALKSFNEFYKI